MGLSDILFDCLEELDDYERQFPISRYRDLCSEEYFRRMEEFYRLMTNSMRILQLHNDQFPPVNDIAFFDRAMQMIREDDQRPWETLREELWAELARPIEAPPVDMQFYDDQRRIQLDEPPGSTTQSAQQTLEAPAANEQNRELTGDLDGSDRIPDEDLRQIHIPTDAGPAPKQARKGASRARAKSKPKVASSSRKKATAARK